MKFPLFTDDDKHPYLWWSLGLIVIANAIIFFDPKLSRAFSVAGSIMGLAGAYWIAAGVVLRASDISDLTRASISGGPKYIGRDPVKEIIPNMLKVQSRRAKFGVACVLVGSVWQIVGAYIA